MTPFPTLVDWLETNRVILAEGAVVERLRRDPDVQLDPFLLHATLIFDSSQRQRLASVYRQYLAIGKECGLPLLIFTPTWRANSERCRMARHSCQSLNVAAVQFLKELRENRGAGAESVRIGGLIGCRGDAYRPEESMDTKTARLWHAPQLEALALGGVDFLFGATLPAASEALGIAMAMAALRKPYLISFIIQPDGCLLDGTPLEEIILRIDNAVSPAPLAYSVNCVHHSNFRKAMESLRGRGIQSLQRLIGLQANTSAKSPEELDGSARLECEDPCLFAQGLLQLHQEFGLKILGGCCGTNDRHIRELAKRLAGLYSTQ
jgi:homocysteine S-methyltransferase